MTATGATFGRRLGLILLACAALGWATVPVLSQEAEAETEPVSSIEAFPRLMTLASGTLTLFEPQIGDHENFEEVTGWMAAAFERAGAIKRSYGAVRFRAKLVSDLAVRTVTIYDRELIDSTFPELDEAAAAALTIEIEGAIRTAPETIPLDVVLAYLSSHSLRSRAVDVSMAPPTILYRSSATMLVQMDGPPRPVAIAAGNDLHVIVNTNWDMFYAKSSGRYWLLLGESWIMSDSLDGGWRPAFAPPGIEALGDDDRWARVRAATPGSPINQAGIPDIIVASEPTELIVTDGELAFDQVPDTSLAFVANTSRDIVFDGQESRYYFLTAGRWFASSALEGPWESVTDLPASFYLIPEDHARAHVRASVAGTTEANMAVIQAQIPQTAEVARGTQAPEVRYAGNPEFTLIDGTDVARATNTTFDVLLVGNSYYLCHNAIWFVSASPTGSWVVAEEVPGAVYTIPASSPSHHVTYVSVYGSSPGHVYVGYTAGYHHTYVSFGVTLYGSGYYWPPYYDPFYYGWYPYWYYYPYPRTYGYASTFNPITGAYGHGHYAYGPYGGYWGGERYNPRTGRYGQGAYVWDYNDAAYSGWSYNPRNDIGIQTDQAIHWNDNNSYDSWGQTVVSRDDEWVRFERDGTEDGFRRTIETSRGGEGVQYRGERGRGTAFRTEDGDIYAGANGSVFRRTDDGGWQRRQDGDWQTIDPQEFGSNVRERASNLSPTERAAIQDRASNIGPEQRQATRDRLSQTNPNFVGPRQRSGSQGYGGYRGSAGGQLNQYQRLNRDQWARQSGNQRYQQYQQYRSQLPRTRTRDFERLRNRPRRR